MQEKKNVHSIQGKVKETSIQVHCVPCVVVQFDGLDF